MAFVDVSKYCSCQKPGLSWASIGSSCSAVAASAWTTSETLAAVGPGEGSLGAAGLCYVSREGRDTGRHRRGREHLHLHIRSKALDTAHSAARMRG